MAGGHRPKPARGVLHVLGDPVAVDPGVRAFRRRPGIREPRVHRGQVGQPSARRGGEGLGVRHGLLFVLLRRHRHVQVSLRQRCGLRGGDRVHVRLHQPGPRARHRAHRLDGMAVRRQRVRRRVHHDRPPHPGRWPLAEGAAGGQGQGAPRRRYRERPQARAAGGHRAPARALGQAPAVSRRVVRRRHLHHGRPDHAPEGAARRLHRCRVSGGRRARLRMECRVPPRPRVLDEPGERDRGPFIAIISFVCSIGNVPMAAALWKGGISFGGVVSFIFADLITFPLLLIYRRYYGTRLMLRMLAIFWGVMSTAGLITEGIFKVAGLIPANRPAEVAPAHFSWNYTTYLNIVFLVLFAAMYWAYRNRERLGGEEHQEDDVCGMQVETANAPPRLSTKAHGSTSVRTTAGDDSRQTRSASPPGPSHPEVEGTPRPGNRPPTAGRAGARPVAAPRHPQGPPNPVSRIVTLMRPPSMPMATSAVPGSTFGTP